MKVDKYRSKTKPSYGLVVWEGADLSSFSGEVAEAIKILQPLERTETCVELDSICCGNLFTYLQTQLQEHGAGLEKTEVRFSELINAAKSSL